MSDSVIDLSTFPREIQEKIADVLGQRTIPQKPTTLEEALPYMDITQEQKEAILKVISPEFKQNALNHEKLEALMKKNRSKPDVSRSIGVLRDELEKRKRRN